MESIDILPIKNLPEVSSEDEEKLQQLRNDFEKISEKNKKIVDNNFNVERLQQLAANPDRLLIGETVDIEAKSQKLGIYSARVSDSQAHLSKLSKLKGQCPTCEEYIDEDKVQRLKDQYYAEIVESNDILEGLEIKIREAKKNNERMNRRDALQKEFEETMGQVDNKLPSQIFDKEEVSAQIATLSSKIQGLQEEIRTVAAENNRATQHNTRLEIIQEQTANFEGELEEIVEALGKVEEKSTHLEILKKAFSTNGLLAYKIENLVKDLEDLTNDYLAELSEGRFSLEFVVTNDRLNVEITDNAKIVDILALSSGELARVNTATLLAIRKLMSSISSSRINTLFLDEIISVLDDEGKEKLVEILLGEELNTYLVSHGWTHPLLEKIEVIKEDNISRLE